MRQFLNRRVSHPFPDSVWPDEEPETGPDAVEPMHHGMHHHDEVHQTAAHPATTGQAAPPPLVRRPTPHFFWNDAPGNENQAAEAGEAPSGWRTPAADSPHNPTFEMPAWFDDGEGQRTDRRRAMAIAAALTVSCGVGLGVVLLQLQDATGPRQAVAATSQLQTIEPVTMSAAQKPVQARIDGATYTAALPQPPASEAAATPAPKANAKSAKADVVVNRQAAPAATAPRPQALDPRAPDLRQRAGERLMTGDIAGARAFFLKAVQYGDAGSAFQLARTYDPEVLAGMDVIGPQADPRLALHWYQQAASGGYEAAILRLDQLRSRARQATN